jgi:hypothetical protein
MRAARIAGSDRGRGIEPYGIAGPAQGLAHVVIEHAAAARGDHDAVVAEQLEHQLPLLHAKAPLAGLAEQRRDRPARPALELLVGVDEGEAGAPGEEPPHGRLARAAQADEEEPQRNRSRSSQKPG